MAIPMSVEEIAATTKFLSLYEQNEIWQYVGKGIYFIGRNREAGINELSCFTDVDGYFITEIYGHILYRYEVISRAGRGSNSEVFQVYDHCLSKVVAVKVARRLPGNDLVNEFTYLEMLQRRFPKKTAQILQVYDYFIFRHHYCIVEEMLFCDLKFKISTFKYGVPVDDVKDLIYSAFKGLNVLADAGLVHGDLKPSNIAVSGLLIKEVKIIDFSTCHSVQQNSFASYMQTRYYRAPETILHTCYGPPIDTWSLGCIAAELLLGYPLFRGYDEADQLSAIIEILGLPPAEIFCMSRVASKYIHPNGNFNTSFYRRFKIRTVPGAKNFEIIFGRFSSPDLVDFMTKCLTWDPNQRIKPHQAVRHRWFGRLPSSLEEIGVLLLVAIMILLYLKT